uniref:MORN repeat-containing protein n=1 Tax=Marseillevirus sp. TaxID=2809551 RepID=A0AA96IYJ6_9VIRU|nr:hypothetical protein MarDSR_242 [Marseillevirus sp.]
MQSFLEKKDVISFSLVFGAKNISPDNFISTTVGRYEDSENCFTEKSFLPDGTKHGKYSKNRKKYGWTKKAVLSYKMGKLHGDFYAEKSCGDTFKCSGEFRHGLPVGKFLLSSQRPNKREKKFCVSFQEGRAVLFEGEGKKYPVVWKKKTLEAGGKKYIDFYFSDWRISCIHENSLFGWDVPDFLLAKFSTGVYALDQKGKLVKVSIPVFLQK